MLCLSYYHTYCSNHLKKPTDSFCSPQLEKGLCLPLFLIVCYNVIYEKDLILPNFYVYKYQNQNPNLSFVQSILNKKTLKVNLAKHNEGNI
jgi:hypothetical protein